MKDSIGSVRRKEKEGTVHPWSAMLLVVVDSLWALTGWGRVHVGDYYSPQLSDGILAYLPDPEALEERLH